MVLNDFGPGYQECLEFLVERLAPGKAAGRPLPILTWREYLLNGTSTLAE